MAKVGCWTCGGDWFVCLFLAHVGIFGGFGDSLLAARVCGDVIDVFFWGWVDHIFDSKSRPGSQNGFGNCSETQLPIIGFTAPADGGLEKTGLCTEQKGKE